MNSLGIPIWLRITPIARDKYITHCTMPIKNKARGPLYTQDSTYHGLRKQVVETLFRARKALP